MLYSYVSNGRSLANTSDLAIRAIDDSGELKFDVIVRMLGESGNTYIRSLGTVRREDVEPAYRGGVSLREGKVVSGSPVWVNALALRPAVLSSYGFCQEGDDELQAMIILAGKDHNIELNREKLRKDEGGCASFCVLRLMTGDVACIDSKWLFFDKGLRRINRPGFKVEMTNFSSEFNLSQPITTNVTLF